MASTITPTAKPDTAALPVHMNFAWSLAGTVAQAAAQWLVVVMIARLGGASAVGDYALALGIAGPVFLLSNCHLRTILATDFRDEYPIQSYLNLRLMTSLFALAGLITCTPFLPASTRMPLFALSIWKVAESISDIFYGYFQRCERMDLVGQSMLSRSLGLLIMVITFMQTLGSVSLALFASAISAMGVAWMDCNRTTWPQQWTNKHVDRQAVYRLARRAAPLGLLLVLVSTNASIPRYFLALTPSATAAVGLFSATAYVAVALNTLVIAMGQALSPAMALQYSRRDRTGFQRDFSKLVLTALVLGGMGVIAGVYFGTAGVQLLYGKSFATEQAVVVWMMVGGALSYLSSAFGYAMSSMRLFASQLPLLITANLTTALACMLWTPRQELLGAAMAQAAGYGVQLTLSAGIVAWRWHARFPEKAQ